MERTIEDTRPRIPELEPLRARFTCGACGERAADVTLWPPFAVDPRRLTGPDAAAELATIGVAQARLAVDGGPVSVTIHPLRDVPAIIRALIRADAAGLYSLDPEFAPFWCSDCRAPYCGEDWTVEVLYDDGFYDRHRGTCPSGHVRTLAD